MTINDPTSQPGQPDEPFDTSTDDTFTNAFKRIVDNSCADELAPLDELDEIDALVGRISGSEVDEQLRRVLRRAGCTAPPLQAEGDERLRNHDVEMTRRFEQLSFLNSPGSDGWMDVLAPEGALQHLHLDRGLCPYTLEAQQVQAVREELRAAQDAIAAARCTAERMRVEAGRIVEDAKAEAETQAARIVRGVDSYVEQQFTQAEQIIAKAHAEAEQLLSSAQAKADRLLTEAQAEAENLITAVKVAAAANQLRPKARRPATTNGDIRFRGSEVLFVIHSSQHQAYEIELTDVGGQDGPAHVDGCKVRLAPGHTSARHSSEAYGLPEVPVWAARSDSERPDHTWETDQSHRAFVVGCTSVVIACLGGSAQVDEEAISVIDGDDLLVETVEDCTA